ncbi:MAG TPA: amidohydrolase family protein [Acidimicrobiales bacterium]|nr:amidohydrolase family protein [Acidimicrobiales bacterium]
MPTPPPHGDEEVAGYIARLGLPGIVDVHVHFMPDAIQQAVWRHFDNLEPSWPVHYRQPQGDRLATLADLGVRHCTALAYAHRPGVAGWLNRHTLALAADHPLIVPTFTFYPEPGVLGEVDRALAAGAACAKVHLQVGRFDANDQRLDGVWSRLEAAGTPIVMHAGAVADGSGGDQWCGPEPVARLLHRFPDLRLVVAHLGAPRYDDFLDLAERHPGVHLDTAMALARWPRLGEPPADLRDRLGRLQGRVVWGSDFPTVPFPYAVQVEALATLGLGDDWLRSVLWEAPARLLGVA